MEAEARFKRKKIRPLAPGKAVNIPGRIRLLTENSNAHFFKKSCPGSLPIPKEKVSSYR